MDLRVSHVPPSGCMWGPAGCPGRSDVSIQGRGPTPRTAPSSWYTAGHSRSGLSRPHWFLSLGRLRTGSPRLGRLYLIRERHGQGRSEQRSQHNVYSLVKGVEDADSVEPLHVSHLPFIKVFLREYSGWSTQVWGALEQLDSDALGRPPV